MRTKQPPKKKRTTIQLDAHYKLCWNRLNALLNGAKFIRRLSELAVPIISLADLRTLWNAIDGPNKEDEICNPIEIHYWSALNLLHQKRYQSQSHSRCRLPVPVIRLVTRTSKTRAPRTSSDWSASPKKSDGRTMPVQYSVTILAIRKGRRARCDQQVCQMMVSVKEHSCAR